MHFGLEGTTPYFLYGSAILVLLGSIFWRPEIGIYFIVPLFPLQTIREKIFPLPLGNKLIDIILLGVFLGALFSKDVKLFPRTPVSRTLLVFVVFLYVSLWQGSFYLRSELPWSIDDPRFSVWKNYMIMPLVFVLVLSVIREAKQVKILILLMCFTALLANKSLYNALSGIDLSHFSYEIRQGGAFGWAGVNGAGAFDAWFTLFLLGLYSFQRKLAFRIAIIGLAAFSMYCLMLTFSRGAYFGLLIGLLFLGIVRQRKILPFLFLFLLTWQAIVPTSVKERVMMTRDESGQLDDSAATRVTLWEDAVKLIEGSPIIGTGFDTYEHMHRLGITVGETELTDTHNYYLKVLVETGAVGLILYLLILVQMFRAGYQLYRTAQDPFWKGIGLGFFAAIIPVVLVNFFGDRWQYIQITGYLWVLLGCVLRGLLLTQDEALRAVAVPNDEQILVNAV
jgi:putative inorganic carbon (HCO3(-)) transporter